MKKIGLIVNPIAGMGGKVGLKGTDGLQIVAKARAMGAVPESPRKTVLALEVLNSMKNDIKIVTCSGDMGENVARQSGFKTEVIMSVSDMTTSDDTEKAALCMLQEYVELIVFAGGDGTARNIYNSIGDRVPVIGIPAGVKIHSAVYATNPKNAGRIALLYLENKVGHIREAEVMDIDEDAFRDGRVTASLYGFLKVPYERNLIQNLKAGRTGSEQSSLNSIADQIIKNMENDVLYVIGPGTTTRPIMERLDLYNELLGVDVVMNRKLVANDVNEAELLNLLEDRRAYIIVTVIGGQGYIFGRGNQQISSDVIKKVGKDNIIVIATKNKLVSLEGSPLLVDTGSDDVNKMLAGYIRVLTGHREEMIYRVEC